VSSTRTHHRENVGVEHTSAVVAPAAASTAAPVLVRLISESQLKDLGVPWSREWRWKLTREGKFPEPVRLSENRIAYREDELARWMADLPRGPVAITETQKRSRQESGRRQAAKLNSRTRRANESGKSKRPKR
jgi:predicted DNA-binding transcriptional regulator AlpA